MSRIDEYIGSSIAFPFQINESGKLFSVKGENSILSSCIEIITTPIGQRLFLPEYGCKISKLLYRTYTSGTKELIETVVSDAIETWEGRATFKKIEFDESGIDKGIVVLHIFVEVKATYEIISFTYPFYTKLKY